MTVSYDEFIRLNLKKEREQARARVDSLRVMAQAQPRADLLTNDPNWDLFLRFLQAQLEEREKDRAYEVDLLCTCSSTDSVWEYKHRIAFLDGEITALKLVMSIPSTLREGGEKAKELLKELEDA